MSFNSCGIGPGIQQFVIVAHIIILLSEPVMNIFGRQSKTCFMNKQKETLHNSG